MTNLDLIKSFDADAMALMLAQICYERDEIMLEKLASQGVDVSRVMINPVLQVEIHKRWLLEEAELKEEQK